MFTVMEAKNINDSCIFDLQWHVIAMHGNSSEEIASTKQQLLSKKYVSWTVVYNVLGKHCLAKHFAISKLNSVL